MSSRGKPLVSLSDLLSAARIAGIYALFAGAWIFFSDRFLALFVSPDDLKRYTWLQTFKGLAFVLVTAGLLFGLVVRRLHLIREAQFEATRARDRMRTFAEHFPGIAFIKDRQGKVIAMRGRTPSGEPPRQELVGRTLDGVLPPENLEVIRRNDEAVFATGQGSQVIETLDVSQGRRHFLVHRFLLREPGGEALLGGISLDVTERQEAEQRIRDLARDLEQADRMKDQFLTNLSHELRTPITAIRLWVDVLTSGAGDDPETTREAVTMIRHSAVTQSLLIEDLLDLTRIITGRLRVQMKPMRLSEVVERTVDVLAPTAAERDVKVETDVPAGGCLMIGDDGRVQQIVWNLLTNAIKFSETGGVVTCRLSCDGDEWELTIADRGRGIPPDRLPHLFERFRASEETRSYSEGGLGIGLSITKHLVEAHGGTIAAASDGPGHGATFTVRFPVAHRAAVRADAPAPAADTADQIAVPLTPAGEPSLAGRHILLVEDRNESRSAMSLLLQRVGATVTGVDSAEAALEATGPFDLLLSDLGLPERDGCELMQELRSRPEWQTKPAIAISAYALPEDRARAINAGFDEFVTKPVDGDKLLRLIAELLEKKEQTPVAGGA